MANRLVKQTELKHWGIFGMKWGVRRFQNENGTRTSAGKRKAGDLQKPKETSKEGPKKKPLSKQELLETVNAYIKNLELELVDPESKKDSELFKLIKKEYADALEMRKPEFLKTATATDSEWASKNDKYFSEIQKKAFTIPERQMLIDMGSSYSPSKTEDAFRVDSEHHPFHDDGFGNHYAVKDQAKTTYWYNHETDTYSDIKQAPGEIVKEIWNAFRSDDEKVKHSDQVEDYLNHSGVDGMHWGIRRYQKKDGTRTALGKAREESEDYAKSRENSGKGSESLSNEELKKLNERLRLEADYKSLTTVKLEKAESFVGDAMKKAASQALTSFASGLMLGAAKSLVKEIAPSLAEAAGFGVKAAVAAATQAPAQAQAQAQAPAGQKLTKSQRKAAAEAARKN